MKRNARKRVVLSAILVISMLLSTFISANAQDPADEFIESPQENVYNKIHFYFANDEHSTIDSEEELTVAVESLYQYASLSYDEVQLTVQFVSNLRSEEKYQELLEKREEVKSLAEMDELRKELNPYSKQYHADLVEECAKLLEFLPYQDMTHIEYSPFVQLNIAIADLKAEDLVQLAKESNILHVSLAFDIAPSPTASWTEAVDAADAFYLLLDETYTGDGVDIGIYDITGVCDENAYALEDSVFYINPSAGNNISSHATNVAIILSTIAPDANYCVSKWFQYGIQWFLDLECDIVCCSYSYYYNTRNGHTYSKGLREYRMDIDALYDYQIEYHWVTVVTGAGNTETDSTKEDYNPDSEIVSPGYAYNAITVGGVTLTSDGRWVHDSGTAYASNGIDYKPDISAPSVISLSNGTPTSPNWETVSGTSFAAPQVAGYIALLLEADVDEEYYYYPDKIHALLLSTAEKTADYSEDVDFFDTKVGAGMVNLTNMLNPTGHRRYENRNTVGATEIDRITVYLEAGDEIQIGLAWLAGTDRNYDPDEDGTITNMYLTNYDLRLFEYSSFRVATSNSTHSSTEMIRYTALESGTYTISVYQVYTGYTNNYEDEIAVFWTIE